jgi:hypothetical protein
MRPYFLPSVGLGGARALVGARSSLLTWSFPLFQGVCKTHRPLADSTVKDIRLLGTISTPESVVRLEGPLCARSGFKHKRVPITVQYAELSIASNLVLSLYRFHPGQSGVMSLSRLSLFSAQPGQRPRFESGTTIEINEVVEITLISYLSTTFVEIFEQEHHHQPCSLHLSKKFLLQTLPGVS